MVACCQLAWLHGAWCWLAATGLLLRMNAATRSCWLVSTPASACQQLTSCGVQLLPETLYLTCSIIDRFLEKKGVLRKRLQLVRNQSGMLCGCLVQICLAQSAAAAPPDQTPCFAIVWGTSAQLCCQ